MFLVRKISGADAGTLYAMKVLKKATLKGNRSPPAVGRGEPVSDGIRSNDSELRNGCPGN